MSFKDAIVTCLKDKYFCFSGRARRSEYWFFTLFTVIIGAVLGVLGNSTAVQVVTLLVDLALLMPSLGVTVRRLHDIGKHWSYIFMALIPIAGAIIMIVKCAQAGVPGSNEYGPDPKAVEVK